MTNESLTEWLEYHSGAYPGFGQWLAKNPDQIQFIGTTLAGMSIESMKQATDQLYQTHDQPRGYGSHARAIRDIVTASYVEPVFAAISGGPQSNGDRLEWTCPRCRDYGLVSVLNPNTLCRLFQDDMHHNLITCCLRCSCQAGAKFGRLPLWARGIPLLAFEDIMDAAMEREPGLDLFDRMWDVARASLLDWHDQNRTPQELAAELLP